MSWAESQLRSEVRRLQTEVDRLQKIVDEGDDPLRKIRSLLDDCAVADYGNHAVYRALYEQISKTVDLALRASAA